MSHYHSVLGIPSSATKEEIKKAYRKKARQYHPDINPAPDAHERFIEITEAYECLTNFRSPKNTKKQKPVSKEDLENMRREKARKRAAYYAKMKYEKFTQTAYYKKSQAANVVFDHLFLLISIFLICAPILGLILSDHTGFMAGALITFFTIPLWAKIFTKDFKVNFKDFYGSLKIIIKTQTFWILIFSALNIYLIYKVVFNTLIPLEPVIISLLILYLPLGLINYFDLKIFPKNYRSLINFCLLPGLFNLFFLLNYVFTFNPTIESYEFRHQRSSYKRGTYNTSLIYLDNNVYEDYILIRWFADYEETNISNVITYHFEEGLFGIKVLKSYKFGK